MSTPNARNARLFSSIFMTMTLMQVMKKKKKNMYNECKQSVYDIIRCKFFPFFFFFHLFFSFLVTSFGMSFRISSNVMVGL